MSDSYRKHLKPEEVRSLAAIDAEIAPMLDRVQTLRTRRNRIVNRAINRGRASAKAARDVSRATNANHVNGIT